MNWCRLFYSKKLYFVTGDGTRCFWCEACGQLFFLDNRGISYFHMYFIHISIRYRRIREAQLSVCLDEISPRGACKQLNACSFVKLFQSHA